MKLASFFILLVCLLCSSRAQDMMDDPMGQQQQQQQQQITLTKEMVDNLLRVLSPPCRQELEMALEKPDTDISNSCKGEIQNTLAGGAQQGPNLSGEDENFPPPDAMGSGSRRGRRNTESKGNETMTIVSIVAFIVTFFAGLGGAAYYINSKLSTLPPKVVKKLSKKKEEKMKQKEQRKNAL